MVPQQKASHGHGAHKSIELVTCVLAWDSMAPLQVSASLLTAAMVMADTSPSKVASF